MKTTAMAIMMAAAALAATGCASRDGRMHTPMTGISVHRAYEAAEADGWVRIDEAGGTRVWVRAEQVAPLTRTAISAATAQERMLAAAERVLLAQTSGKTDAQIVSAYNPTGVTWARLGDGALATALAGGIVWGVSEIDASSSSSSDGGGNTTFNLYNAAGGNQQIATGGGAGGTTQTATGGANTSGEGTSGTYGAPTINGKRR